MSFELGLYTVILLVGPSQSGKTTWVEHFTQKIHNVDETLRVAHLSSDDIRREILGEDLDKYDPKMMEASEAAFDLLFDKLKANIRFPINQEFVVVDTTGLDFDFRKKVSALAHENAYRVAIVMFDYQTSDYFKGLNSREKTVVSKHVENFKKRVLPTIKRKHFDYSFNVREKSKKFFDNLDISLKDYKLWNDCQLKLDPQRAVAFLGDIHEHIKPVWELIAKLPEDVQLISIGDIFDKGLNTLEALEFAESFHASGHIIVKGNHESFVARRLRGELEAVTNEEDNFSSLKFFFEHPQLAKRFLTLYEKMLPFAVVKTHGKTIYATHAPCFNKSLGKMDERSQKWQRNFYFSNREPDTMLEELDFIEKEAQYSHPIHVFGHVAHDMKQIEVKNKIWLDTGSVYGGKLSALLVYPDGEHKIISLKTSVLREGYLLNKKSMKSVPSKVASVSLEELPELPPLSDNVVIGVRGQDTTNIIEQLTHKYHLSQEDVYWLKSFKESGAKFISGTMSPARATKEKLEPIHAALQYFKSQGVEEVVLEPKYMGSRLQVYLHRDKSLDFAITRSGAKAGHQDKLNTIFSSWHEVLDKESFWQNTIVLDGEFLPWSAIGQELIDREFMQYGQSVKEELSLLTDDTTFKSFAPALNFDIESHQKGIDTFLTQLALYGQNMPVEYKPFTILSVDGVSWLDKNQSIIFKRLMPDEPQRVIYLNSDNTHEQANEFFEQITQNLSHEGVVVKPTYFKEGVAPYIKVRNEQYLHLIYGYDYLMNYQYMVDKKRINKKLELSIKEFNLGQKMLVATDEATRLDLACQMKFEINQESELDPRL